MRALLIAVHLLAAAMTLAAAPAVRAEGGPAAIIVLDGSGSMWGELGAERMAKFDIARQSIRAELATVSPGARLGLMAFGHRRKGDCSDVELIVPPSAGPADQIAGPLDKVNPRGKGPVVMAMREAHKALAALDPAGPATIILLQDGPDNCGQDPCAAAAQLAKTRRVPIHLIGLGLDKAEAQRLACVPRLTGGKLFEVIDQAGTKTAIAEAMKLASLQQPSASEPTAAQQTPAAPAVAPDTEGPSRVHLTAALAEGGSLLQQPIKWTIAPEGQPDQPVLQRQAAEIREPLPAGSYVIEAHYGLALTRGPLVVADKGETALTVPLNAGTVRLSAKSARTGEPLAEAIFSVHGDSAAGAVTPVWIGHGDHDIVLPAGAYVVRLREGRLRSEQKVNLTAGGQASAEFTPAVGVLQLSAVAHEGGPPLSDVTYLIEEDDPDAPQGRREFARSAFAAPALTLSAGTYYVTARTRQAEVRQRIAVGPGDSIAHPIVLGLAQIEVQAGLDSGLLPAGSVVLHRVLTLDGEPREVARSSAANATFTLAAGRYRFETRAGNENVASAADITVEAGRDLRITQKLLAGRATVTAPRSGPGSGGAGGFEVRDSRGDVVWRSSAGEARTSLLAPGRYVVRAQAADQTVEKMLEIKAGEQRSVDFATP